MTVARTETFKYDQVSRYINELIEKGDLKPGDKAPSLRKLSKQLNVSIATITQSYVNLEDQGVLSAKPQSGFYVNDLASQINDIAKSTSAPCQARRVRFGELSAHLADKRQLAVVISQQFVTHQLTRFTENVAVEGVITDSYTTCSGSGSAASSRAVAWIAWRTRNCTVRSASQR